MRSRNARHPDFTVVGDSRSRRAFRGGETAMDDARYNQFTILLSAVEHVLLHGAPSECASSLACVWSRDPQTHRVECHWVREEPARQ